MDNDLLTAEINILHFPFSIVHFPFDGRIPFICLYTIPIIRYPLHNGQPIFEKDLQNNGQSCKLVISRKGRREHLRIKLNEAQESALRAFLQDNPDAEALSAREYVVDLYEIEPPVSLDLVFVKGGIGVDGAAELLYDEELDGWYMGERLETPERVRAALVEAGAIPE
jgi:hypothetical protein